jgi:hypothetical protein
MLEHSIKRNQQDDVLLLGRSTRRKQDGAWALQCLVERNRLGGVLVIGRSMGKKQQEVLFFVLGRSLKIN